VVHQAIDAIAADEEEAMLAALVQQWQQNSNVAAAYELGVAFADAIPPVRVSNPIRALEWFERAALVSASVVKSKPIFPITLSIVGGIDDGPEDYESELVFESIGFADDIKLMRHIGACLRLGLIRDQGDCCDPDSWAAVRAFRWAASRRGSADAVAAARQLGLLFSVGRQGQHTISPDEYAAVRWMMRAAIADDAQAKVLLVEWMGQEVSSLQY
jgi:TPR repeat protein